MNSERRRFVPCIHFLLRPVTFLALLLVQATDSFGLRPQTSKRPFTVRDSIEMTTFSDPYTRSLDAKCKFSPDKEYFFVITTKGDLDSNQLQSSLWLYSTAQVSSFLHSRGGAVPKPQLLWENGAVPKAQQLDSYGSLITEAHWTADSRNIMFLAETGDGVRRLYSLNIENRRILSVSTADVEDYSESSGTVAYAVKTTTNQTPPTISLSPDSNISSVLTGHTLFNIFDPGHFPQDGSIYPSGDLWVLSHGQHIQINQTTGPKAWRYPAAAMSLFHLALSPDGKNLIAAKPVSTIDESWNHFLSRNSEFSFEKLPRTEAKEAGDWNWPWQYVSVDVKHNSSAPIVKAPNAWIAGYPDAVLAAWSRDSSRVLFTNTFLPPLPESDTRPQTIPCAVAVFTVATQNTECVSYTRYPQMRLTDASFRNTPDEIQLAWITNGTPLNETYRFQSGRWNLMASAPERIQGVEPLIVAIHQDLNQPPALWVTDSSTGETKELWNPNPQLAALKMGRASIFHWRDESGYEWTAGLLKPYGYTPGHRYPLVILTHGFDQHEFLVDGSYTTGFAAQPLATAGIMVLQMEDRRDRHLKPASEEATLFGKGCAAAIQQLIADGLVDPGEIGIIGFSRTSWYVETTLEMYPELFKAATIIDGIDQGYASYILLCPGVPLCEADHLAVNGGPPFGKELFHWLAVAPSFNLNKIRAPLRIEAIRWYSILQEWEIYSALYQQGKPVDLIYIPGGQHILQQPQQRYVSQQGNVDWFRFWLQGYEAPDAEKKAEYWRWEHLLEPMSASKAESGFNQTK